MTMTNPQTSLLGDKPVHRIGFGAMQLAGPGVFGPPRDPDGARAVLRRAVELGVDHIDTAQFYGPDVVNELIREALYPYPEGLRLVTKVGARRDESGGWVEAQSPAQLRADVEANLRSLNVERMDLVNLRIHSGEGPSATGMPTPEQLGELADLRQEGKLDLIGVSTVPLEGVKLARELLGTVGDRLRAVLPARVGVQRRTEGAGRGPGDRRRGRQARRHPVTGGACVAAAPLRADPAHPRHELGRPPRGEPRRGRRATRRGGPRDAARGPGHRPPAGGCRSLTSAEPLSQARLP
jgi:hypothetical protein